MRMTSASERDICKIALALGDSIKVRFCVVIAVDGDVATVVYGQTRPGDKGGIVRGEYKKRGKKYKLLAGGRSDA
jgi:hypothetical protein